MIEDLIKRIEAHCATSGESETAFGLRAVNDGKLLNDLRRGRSITLKTLDRIDLALTPASVETDSAQPAVVNQ